MANILPLGRRLTRKRILIVNCFFDESRQAVRRTAKMPQTLGPIYLAGAFNPQLCEIRLYDEVYSGPLINEHLFTWPDMLVMTGLTNAFDRMRHLTAYARTKNPKTIVVAGGPAIRALSLLAREYFDYCCLGDIEEMQEVIADAFGPAYVNEEMVPRFDLAYWLRYVNYAETTRNCNFRCSFCALTGENRAYKKYDLEQIRKQIMAGRRRSVIFADNNFYGNDRSNFLERLALIKAMRGAGYIKDWAALVTADFFRDDQNLKVTRDAGCRFLFSGVEAFDTKWLASVNKAQNNLCSQVEMIRKCLKSGVLFSYGLMCDVDRRHIWELRRELDLIMSTPDMTLPSFLTLPIPILGTPFFYECLKNGVILPRTKLRDMDGSTLVCRPLDPINEVLKFLGDMMTLSGYRWRVLKHSTRFVMNYHSILTRKQLSVALVNAAMLCAYSLVTSPATPLAPSGRGRSRTFISTTELLDAVYIPSFRVASNYESYFNPTMVTDERGELSTEMARGGLWDPLSESAPPKLIASLLNGPSIAVKKAAKAQ
ncbi:MAG TPA: radical SAM protein [Pyrinomonadaceae bacterium]|nr:radical SAM protein [Pyrinomonadaceae bacterium]